MRKLRKRPKLSTSVTTRLERETTLIEQASDQKLEAERLYSNARQAVWFREAIDTLKKMAGRGERCMFCSGSESSDAEHFRPLSTFPTLALTWKNLLWACSICNRAKLNRFPLDADKLLINPVEEYVWDFFFIDKFGLLTPRWNIALDAPEPRAVSTMEVVSLDRQALQETRQSRLRNLKRQVQKELAALQRGELSKQQLKKQVRAWLGEPFQSDIADYFLNGPGKSEKPFSNLFKALKDT